ncbi:inositol polyphosphate multikinase beta-like isoform X2 [Penaeus japonicus]|nr:inositol polyphosphate multikinase beta-like isoform X2 [Penaeus japonicus]XP_042863657.1 inositol polyphosphate multikinase beta-like isoform X2 [Penaeus japonicus]XP_042863659.1 inositol polyphosphate multikinase beta-like isoform X2 [Penaeus japonicus]
MGDFQDYEHQVGGWHNGSASHILKDRKGHILKPLKLNANPTYETPTTQKDFTFEEESKEENDKNELVPVCRDECQFYERVKNSTHADDVSLLPLMPMFYGCVDVDEDGKKKPHLVLEDLAAGMSLPCITDLKVGYTNYYPCKEQKKKKTAPRASQKELGFCLTGMRVFDPETGKLVVNLQAVESKCLTTKEVLEKLSVFCQHKHPQSQIICSNIISNLKEIHKWFSKQRSYIVRTSSVLLAYDASLMTKTLHLSPAALSDPQVASDSDKDSDQNERKEAFKVKVKMIDFAHVLNAFGEKDDNYLSSLESLIDIFSNRIS